MKDPDIISDTPETQQNQQIIKDKLKQQQQQQLPTQSSLSSSNNSQSQSPQTTIIESDLNKLMQNNEIPKFNKNVKTLPSNNQITELHTVLRDRLTNRSDFKFYADRLIRLLVEEGLNQLPYSESKIITSAGCEYVGLQNIKGVCGVAIMRSGEAMEKGLRECCRSIRIGKILIQSIDEEKKQRRVVYAKFPDDIISRKILLLYPITTTGCTVNLAINVLKEHGVSETNIVLLTLFATPSGIQSIINKYPDVNILTSEIHNIASQEFGQRYFGTE